MEEWKDFSGIFLQQYVEIFSLGIVYYGILWVTSDRIHLTLFVCLLFWTVWCMYSRLQLALSYNQVTTNTHCGFLSTTDSLAVDISSRFR